jgi:hypothetical protein
MAKILGFALLMVGMAGAAFGIDPVPEIDAQSGASAVTLLAGALLVMRSRRSK